MTYQQSLEYLASLQTFGSQLGLRRITELLQRMGNPETAFRSIHVTGTNGKGSTVAFLTSVLQAAGLSCASYTSPHLQRYTERMIINGQEVLPEHFGGAIGYVALHVKEMLADGLEQPTEFEILTAAAFYLFALHEVEYVVVEVGLGGLLDSTNVIFPEVAVITNVTLEHQDRCGNTIAEIAAHKAGIVKRGIPVVTAAVGEAQNVIYQEATAKHAPLFTLNKDFFVQGKSSDKNGQKLTFRSNQFGNLTKLSIALLGKHQLENCALAVMTAHLLAEGDVRITPQAIRAGISRTVWPARFEIIRREKASWVLDVAHNKAGMTVLRQTLDECFGQSPVVFILGILQDKKFDRALTELIRSQDRVIAVTPQSERALPAADLLPLLPVRATAADSLEQAVILAGKQAENDGIICVCGSFYVVGPIREILAGRRFSFKNKYG